MKKYLTYALIASTLPTGLFCGDQPQQSFLEKVRNNELCWSVATGVPLFVFYFTKNIHLTALAAIAHKAIFDNAEKALGNAAIDIATEMLDQQIKSNYQDFSGYHLPDFANGLGKIALQKHCGDEKQIPYTMAETVGSIIGQKTIPTILDNDYLKNYLSKIITQEEYALIGKNICGALMAEYNNDDTLAKAYMTNAVVEPGANLLLRFIDKPAGDEWIDHKINFIKPATKPFGRVLTSYYIKKYWLAKDKAEATENTIFAAQKKFVVH